MITHLPGDEALPRPLYMYVYSVERVQVNQRGTGPVTPFIRRVQFRVDGALHTSTHFGAIMPPPFVVMPTT